MKRWSILVLLIVLAGVSWVSAEEGKAKAPTPAVKGSYRVLKLTDEQKQQISSIQQATAAKIKQLHEEERTQIQALLTDEQKAQLATIEEDARARQRERGKNYREQKKAEKEKAAAN